MTLLLECTGMSDHRENGQYIINILSIILEFIYLYYTGNAFFLKYAANI